MNPATPITQTSSRPGSPHFPPCTFSNQTDPQNAHTVVHTTLDTVPQPNTRENSISNPDSGPDISCFVPVKDDANMVAGRTTTTGQPAGTLASCSNHFTEMSGIGSTSNVQFERATHADASVVIPTNGASLNFSDEKFSRKGKWKVGVGKGPLTSTATANSNNDSTGSRTRLPKPRQSSRGLVHFASQPANSGRTNSNLSKETAEYKAHRLNNARSYLKQTFIAHFILVLVAVGIETIFLELCIKVSPTSPYVALRLQADAVALAQVAYYGSLSAEVQNVTEITRANATLDREVRTFHAVIDNLRMQGNLLFQYEVIFTLASLTALLLVALVVYCFRTNPVVRSRGRLYLILIFVVSVLLVASTIIMAGSYLMQFGQFPNNVDYRLPEVLQREIVYSANLVFVGFSTAIFFTSAYFSTLALRQRLISHVFGSTVRKLTDSHLLLWAFGWTLVSFTMAIPSYIYWRVVDFHHPRGTRYGVAGLFAFSVVFSPLLYYYFYRARRASIKFNDLYSNVRAFFVVEFTFLILLIYNIFINPKHIISACVGWSSMIRFCVSVQVLDQVFTQALQAKWDVPVRPQALQGLSMHTVTRWVKWTWRLEGAPGVETAQTGGLDNGQSVREVDNIRVEALDDEIAVMESSARRARSVDV